MSDIYVIDYETLGTRDDAVLLSMGIVCFKEEWLDELSDLEEDLKHDKFIEFYNRMVNTGLYQKYDVESQVLEYKRTIKESTVEWWATQGEEAYLVVKPSDEDIHLRESHPAIKKWLDYHQYRNEKIYTRGMIDGRWYQHYMEENLGIETGSSDAPMKWWNFRDVRTLVDELSENPNGKGHLPKPWSNLVDFRDVAIKHHALCDAAMDACNIALARIVNYAGLI